MSDKFLGTGYSNVSLTNGSQPIYAATLSALNLQTGMAVKTNNVAQLTSCNLEISDTNGLQAALDSGGGANEKVINITDAIENASTSFKGDILPSTHIVYDLGEAGDSFRDIYTTRVLNADGLTNIDLSNAKITCNKPLEAQSFQKTNGSGIEYLMADGSTLTQSANSGNSNFYLYRSGTSQSTTPPDGYITCNNALLSLATIIYISHLTRDNIDIEVYFKQITTLSEIYIQDQNNSENNIQFNITGVPTLTTGSKVAIPVVVRSSTTPGFADAHQVLVSFFTNSLEVDTRLSTLETKTQNQTAVLYTTTFAGKIATATLEANNISNSSNNAAIVLHSTGVFATPSTTIQSSDPSKSITITDSLISSLNSTSIDMNTTDVLNIISSKPRVNGNNIVGSAITTVANTSVVVFDGSAGKIIKSSPVLISSTGAITGAVSLSNTSQLNITSPYIFLQGEVIANSIIVPHVPGGGSIGDSLLYWGGVYTNGLTIAGNILPNTANERNIGSVSVPFKDVYANKITGLIAPVNNPDGANKLYVDDQKGALVSYTIATLPTAVGKTGTLVYCTNDFNGAVPAFSDGTNWRRVTDRNIVSTTGWIQPTMTSNTSPIPFVASASTIYDSTFDAFKSFDNSIATSWVSFYPRYSGINPGLYTGTVSTTVSGGAVLGEWLQLAFTSALISTYTIVVVDNYKNTSAPTSWVLAGSSNGGATWNMLDTQTRVWTGNNSLTYNIPSPIAINAIRIITKEVYNLSSSPGWVSISQFVLS